MADKRFAVFYALFVLAALALGVWLATGSPDAPADAISFAQHDFSGIDRVKLLDLHTGQDVWLEKSDDFARVIAFLRTVEGTGRTSAKGWHEGSFEVTCYRLDGVVFTLSFGDSASFNHGSHETDMGYANRYSLVGMDIEAVIDFFSQYFK